MSQLFMQHSVTQVCCGGQHAAILTESGHVYTWGRGGFGRLGHGDDALQATPKRVDALALEHVKCKQVACGFAYTAAVTMEGQVYTWGAGENGRLGLGDELDKMRPGHVKDLARYPVKEIFAGSVHTCALLEDGRIFSWGKCEYTGHGLQQDVLSPLHLDAFQGQLFAQVSVGPGGYHTITLSTTGEVYTWGHNRVGQLGYTNNEEVPRNNEGAHFLPTPRRVKTLAGGGPPLRIQKVIAGWGHSAVVCGNGDVYICGRNFQGQLGLGDPKNFERNERNHPYLAHFRVITDLQTGGQQKVKQFACGGEHSAALLNNDEVYTFGAGARGQLGHGDSRNEAYPRLNQTMRATRRVIKDVACGNNCTVMLVGAHRIPPLTEYCLEFITQNWSLYRHIDFAEALPHDLFLALRRLQHHSSFHDLSISISRQGSDQGMDQEDDQDEDQEVDDCLVSVAFSSMSFWEETAVSNASACTSFSQ
ncbi:regulator of chromosome condensation -like protein [Nannochloropsis gaditana]|uniref:Regulator of chromosome condensation-like protein n=1 Tax=Nannochloropsis gaditana TaxID=72520 RepID=W7TK43_9STRA|nr:regulator of chromosome condensation -like protein [Nannochloropsis gaditana]